MTSFDSIRTLADEALVEALRRLVVRSNQNTAELLAHLAEVDSRRLYLEHACPSMLTRVFDPSTRL